MGIVVDVTRLVDVDRDCMNLTGPDWELDVADTGLARAEWFPAES
jgi:hypothetical protein